jgi:hypothetical protein
MLQNWNSTGLKLSEEHCNVPPVLKMFNHFLHKQAIFLKSILKTDKACPPSRLLLFLNAKSMGMLPLLPSGCAKYYYKFSNETLHLSNVDNIIMWTHVFRLSTYPR